MIKSEIKPQWFLKKINVMSWAVTMKCSKMMKISLDEFEISIHFTWNCVNQRNTYVDYAFNCLFNRFAFQSISDIIQCNRKLYTNLIYSTKTWSMINIYTLRMEWALIIDSVCFHYLIRAIDIMCTLRMFRKHTNTW